LQELIIVHDHKGASEALRVYTRGALQVQSRRFDGRCASHDGSQEG